MTCRRNIMCVGKCRMAVFDCTECIKQKHLASGCFNRALHLLHEESVEEMLFKSRQYFYIYGKKEVSRLKQLADVINRISQNLMSDNLMYAEGEAFIKKLIDEVFFDNPTKAYDILCAVLHQHEKSENKNSGYIQLLRNMKTQLEATEIIYLHIRNVSLYDAVKPQKLPSFMMSILKSEIDETSRLIDEYFVGATQIRIYENLDSELLYSINPPEIYLSPKEVESIIDLKDKVAREHTLEIIEPQEARKYFKKLGSRFLHEDLAEVFAKYTAGYGLLETLFMDEKISDIYVDSPAGESPVYVEHEHYGVCDTNLYLSEDDLERIASKFRSIGGRPFDEANPIMDMELMDVGVRVAGVREPATFDGISYAFRKRRNSPWTLPKLVTEGMLSIKSAALLSALISGQCSILITGARGSGKTSLLSALITEIKQTERIVLMEDTPEIPSKQLRELGWRIEHLRNQSPISKKHEASYELSPEENLRAALRLGESVLILGEVRGPEAKALFEAMRVGAAGNSVIGTIHGSSPYDTWDRITNDLNVPPSSFKAVDIVVSVGYRENRVSSKKSRYVRRITEVRKFWEKNPQLEGCFFDLMQYNDASECEIFNLDNSETLMEIASKKGIRLEECKEDIYTRERMIRKIIETARKKNLNKLLEIQHILKTKKEYIKLINENTTYDRIDYRRIFRRWSNWIEAYADALTQKIGAYEVN